MDGLLFSEAEMQVLRESPAYREIMANVQKAVAERAATVGKSMRVEATIPAIEGVQSNVGESRGIAAVPKVATCIGNRAGSDAVTSIALVPPIKVGKLGETVREYNRFESIFGAPRRYRDVLTSKEGQVVEDCVGVDDEVFRDTGGDTLDQSVTMVTENTLECALGVPLHTTLGKARSIGGLMVEVTDGDAELAFGPAACYLQAVLGRGVSVGVFLAWYVRAVVRGYAGSVELRCQRGKWCIRSGRGMPLDCLRQVIGYIGERFSPFDEKVVLKCKNLNPHKVLHPYEWLRQDFPKDCCGELLRAPYCYVVSAVTGTYIGDGVDVAVGQIVGGGAFPCSLEKTNFLYSTSSLSKQEVILSQEVLDGFGKCANYMALNCVDGRMRFAEYVAWCVWLARRGITVHNELSRVDDRWHVKPRRFANAMNAVVAMLTVAAKVYFDTNGPGYTRNIRHIEKLCGFVCNGVSEKLVGFRFEDLEDPRKGSKIGGRVFV